ncbi:MAG: hypothetical protein H6753_01625 [Candidatus Omnitrophica bacterium]|nr:hypothetical protein [Candidatus Omnitrophota bacterium]
MKKNVILVLFIFTIFFLLYFVGNEILAGKVHVMDYYRDPLRLFVAPGEYSLKDTPEVFYLGILIHAILLGLGIAATVWLLKDRLTYCLSPQKYINQKIKDLYQAIKDGDIDVSYRLFKSLESHFKMPNRYGSDDKFIKDSNGTVVDIEWGAFIKDFMRILNEYKRQSSSEREMTQANIEDMINELNSQLEELGSTDCLACGAIIYAHEHRCSKCGWEWTSS